MVSLLRTGVEVNRFCLPLRLNTFLVGGVPYDGGLELDGV